MTLEIHEWEIWHTYSTYLESTNIDLLKTARRLVASGIAECVMLRDGRTFWQSNGVVGSGLTVVEQRPLSPESTFRLDLDQGCEKKPEGFALEAWGQASHFLIGERRVLGEDMALPHPYLRAYLGKCVVTSTASDSTISCLNLYPILIVYASGVLIVEFRMIGANSVTTFDNFINGGVNLFTYQFDRVEVNPGLAAFAIRAYYQLNRPLSLFQRIQLVRLQRGHDFAVKQQTATRADMDFSFDLAPLSSSTPDDLKAIANTIFHTTAFISGSPRMGLYFLLLGQRPGPVVGQLWSGRPHIHLVRFSEQCRTATDNEVRHGSDFGRILGRVAVLDEAVAQNALPKNARFFQDYGAYIGSAASLWVWSLDGLAAQERWMDPNRGNLIYQRQVLAELLEYGYMLHISIYHRIERCSATSKILSVRKEVLRLQHDMRVASHAGEIRELLEYGWKAFGLPSLVSEIDEGLRLRELETRFDEARRSERITLALTIVFGFVAVPALAEQVIEPILKLMTVLQFSDPSVSAVVSDGMAFLIVTLILWATLWALSSSAK